MINLLKLEEAAMFAFALFMLGSFSLPWWLLIILFFSPDFGALGYLVNPRVGASTYNLFHHKAVAIALFLIGVSLPNEYFQITGLIIFAHSSFDRVLGFGLKFTDAFSHTHLGMIGKQKA